MSQGVPNPVLPSLLYRPSAGTMLGLADGVQFPASSGAGAGAAPASQLPGGAAQPNVPLGLVHGIAQLFDQYRVGSTQAAPSVPHGKRRKIRVQQRSEEEALDLFGDDEQIRRQEAAAAAAAQKAEKARVYRARSNAKSAFLKGPQRLLKKCPTLNALSVVLDNGQLQIEARCVWCMP